MINVTGDFVGSVAMEENAECEKERARKGGREREGGRKKEREREVRGQLLIFFAHCRLKRPLDLFLRCFPNYLVSPS